MTLLFPPLSECLDGEVTCFDDFLPDFTSGRLNGSQLNQVSDWLKRFFYFQSNLRDAVIPDIRKIPITPSKSLTLCKIATNSAAIYLVCKQCVRQMRV